MTQEICVAWQKQRLEDQKQRNKERDQDRRMHMFLTLCVIVCCGIEITGLTGWV